MSKPVKQTEQPEEKRPVVMTEEERLLQDMNRSDMEKFLLFTEMLRRNALYKKATITHKP
ncbi:MAG: hypothetical protein WCG87_04940 [Bacteroidota bacterium]